MRQASMFARGFWPLVAEGDGVVMKKDGKIERSKFETGTHAEPGHRQLVRVLAGGRWISAVYDRISCSFWCKLGSGYQEQPWEWAAVKSWTQYPIRPLIKTGLAIDPVIS